MYKPQHRILNYLLLLIGIIGVMDFILLVILAKAVLNFGIIFPGVVGTCLIVYALLRIYNKGNIIKNRVLRRIIAFFIGCLIVSFLLAQGLIFVSAQTDENVEVDYLVILGAGLKGDQITLTFRNRLDKGLEFLTEHPNMKVVVTGGQGPGETISEAEAMERYLVQKGISTDRIIKEDKATSTMENFKYSRKILQSFDNKNEFRIVIITNEFHMFRSKMLAKRNGFSPYGMPAKTNVYILANSCIREYFAIIKSLIFDR